MLMSRFGAGGNIGAMARYHFHILCDGERISDDEGLELESVERARTEAIAGARSIMAADLLQGLVPMNQIIEVEDEHGSPVFALPFADTVEFRL